MDLNWSPEHMIFRAKVRGVLEAHLPADWADLTNGFDVGCDYSVAFARKFAPILANHGLLIPHWPKEYGGQGLDAWHHWILNEEMWGAGEPRSYQYMSVNWAGPAIISFGSAQHKSEHLSRIAAGSLFYCQGFSEPNAGSDLASLVTRATRTASGYVVNGQKIWTSAASFADYCFLLARTGGAGASGISVFLVPMHTPGIEVKVIRSLQGARALHEVFFNDVEIPASSRIGEENQGWGIVSHVLANERIGSPRYTLSLRGLERAVEVLKQRGRFKDSMVRARAARAWAACEASRLMCYQIIQGRVRGLPKSPLTNIARYQMAHADRQVAEFLGDFLQEELLANEDKVLAATYRRAGSTGIAAGAAEIQLNQISRGELHLPRE